MNRWFSVVDVIAPPSCMACGDLLSDPAGILCLRCAVLLPSSVCSVRPLQPVRACWSLGPYTGLLGGLIRTAKYRRSLRVADQLGLWLGDRLKGLVHVDAVVHVPTPWFRKLYRGFDPSDRIARGVALKLGVSHCSLLRRKDTSRQVGKAAQARRHLRPNAFDVVAVDCPERVLIVDDVMTTGATMRAAAIRMRMHGVKHVYAALVAHA